MDYVGENRVSDRGQAKSRAQRAIDVKNDRNTSLALCLPHSYSPGYVDLNWACPEESRGAKVACTHSPTNHPCSRSM